MAKRVLNKKREKSKGRKEKEKEKKLRAWSERGNAAGARTHYLPGRKRQSKGAKCGGVGFWGKPGRQKGQTAEE